MNKICNYNCEHNKSGVCQITGCVKKTTTTNKSTDYIPLGGELAKQIIEELQQENERLKIQLEDRAYEQVKTMMFEYKDRIDSVIEYIDQLPGDLNPIEIQVIKRLLKEGKK